MRNGDLIFSFIGPSDNAISAVTEGFRGARVNHMGVIVEVDQALFVLEAYPPKVTSSDLDEFVSRSADAAGNPRFMVGRVHQMYSNLVHSAVMYGLAQREVPYDVRYLTDQAALYCSELVVDMFKFANVGNEFFQEQPMSFSDTKSGQIHPFWTAYYKRLGIPVPAGEPGSNPGGISRDLKLYIYDVVGEIPGFV